MSFNVPLTNAMTCAALALMTLAGQAAAQVAATGEQPPPTLQVRYEYVGFYSGLAGTQDDCPGTARRNGTVVVEGSLRWALGRPPGNVLYTGKGRVTMNIDECFQKRGKKFEGVEQMEFCTISVVNNYNADVRLDVSGQSADGEPVGVGVRWKAPQPVSATVSGDCESQTIAEIRSRVIAGVYQQHHDITPMGNEDMLQKLVRGGIPRPGRYESPRVGDDVGGWTLSIDTGPVDDTRIAIDGPGCSCINGEDAEGKPVRFTATASAKGGVFEAFTVKSSGKTPRVIANAGGAAPRLDLAGSRETGATTLEIAYTKDGKRYTAEHAVSFCVMDSVTMADGYDDITFDDSDPGKAEFRVLSKASLDGTDISSDLAWTLEAMKGGTELTPGEATGEAVTLGYTNLPRENSAFGPKEVTARAKSGRCNCTRERKPRIFFRALATNHPSAEDSEQKDAANFFFYWMQTAAAKGINTPFYRYKKELPNVNETGGGSSKVAARFVPGEDRIYIAETTLTADCRGPAAAGTRSFGPGNKGIDCFSENLRHEWQHRVDFKTWWPDGYPDPSVGGAWDLVSNLPAALLNDTDGDKVPNTVESSQPGCSRISMRSCPGRPFDDVLDTEIFAYYEGWKWQRGSANKEDWSCNGKQWKGGDCARE